MNSRPDGQHREGRHAPDHQRIADALWALAGAPDASSGIRALQKEVQGAASAAMRERRQGRARLVRTLVEHANPEEKGLDSAEGFTAGVEQRMLGALDDESLRAARSLMGESPEQAAALLCALADTSSPESLMRVASRPDMREVLRTYGQVHRQARASFLQVSDILRNVKGESVMPLSPAEYDRTHARACALLLDAMADIVRDHGDEGEKVSRAVRLMGDVLHADDDDVRVALDVLPHLSKEELRRLDVTLLRTVKLLGPVPARAIEEDQTYAALKQTMLRAIERQFGLAHIDDFMLPYMRRLKTGIHYAQVGPKNREQLVGFLAVTELPGGYAYVDQVTANPSSPVPGLTMACMGTVLRASDAEKGVVLIAAPDSLTLPYFVEEGGVFHGLTEPGAYRKRYAKGRKLTEEEGAYRGKDLTAEETEQLMDRVTIPYEMVKHTVHGRLLHACLVETTPGEPDVAKHGGYRPAWFTKILESQCERDGLVMTRCIPAGRNDRNEQSYLCVFEKNALPEGGRRDLDAALSALKDPPSS